LGPTAVALEQQAVGMEDESSQDQSMPNLRQLLEELRLEELEHDFYSLGVQSVEDLASVRYEELLELGLSKVQCHLFFAKVHSLTPASILESGRSTSASDAGMPLDGPVTLMDKVQVNGDGAHPVWTVAKEAFPGLQAGVHTVEQLDQRFNVWDSELHADARAGESGRSDADALSAPSEAARVGDEVRVEDLRAEELEAAIAEEHASPTRVAARWRRRARNPPQAFSGVLRLPADATPAIGGSASLLEASRPRKRPHSSVVAAIGSSVPPTATGGSSLDTGSSSSSLHMEICIKKRRVLDRFRPPCGSNAHASTDLPAMSDDTHSP